MNPCIPMLRTVKQQALLAEKRYAEAAACSREYIEQAEKSSNVAIKYTFLQIGF